MHWGPGLMLKRWEGWFGIPYWKRRTKGESGPGKRGPTEVAHWLGNGREGGKAEKRGELHAAREK